MVVIIAQHIQTIILYLADIVRESLRRLCIWKNYGAENGIGKEWWDYVNEFNTRCGNSDYFTNDDCIKDVYKHSKVDGKLIGNCIADTGGTNKNCSIRESSPTPRNN
jgi:hypothetical protein